MNIVFGTASALLFGVADFIGGVCTRRSDLYRVIVVQQLAGLLAITLFSFFLPHSPHPADLVYGALAGITVAFVLKFLYAAMSMGDISVTSPVLAVLGSGIPVLYGLTTGKSPSVMAILGICLAIVAIMFVTAPHNFTVTTFWHGLRSPQGELCIVAGVLYGFVLIFIGHIREEAGGIPFVVNRGASVMTALLLFRSSRSLRTSTEPWKALTAGSGMFVVFGALFFTFSAQRGPLEVTGALYSITPVAVVLLSVVLLKERLRRIQWFGLVMSITALIMISAG